MKKKNFNYYYKRFVSKTPAALKSLRKLALGVSAATGAMATSLAAFEKSQKAAIVLGIISGIAAGIAAGCQFGTEDESLKNM